MSDRELLELAAKAAAFEYIKPLPEYDGRLGLELGSNPMRTQSWNPLADDGDALRLAVKLELNVLIDGMVCVARTGLPRNLGVTESLSMDHYSAARRAIVRAAAEIGKAMP